MIFFSSFPHIALFGLVLSFIVAHFILLSSFLYLLLVFVFSEKFWRLGLEGLTLVNKIKPSDVLISPCSKKENHFNQLPMYSNQDFTLKLWIYNLSLKTKNRKIWQQLTHIPLLQPSAGTE